LPFWRPPKSQQSGKGPATFDFLGDFRKSSYYGRVGVLN
jgi:hypothetical protein